MKHFQPKDKIFRTISRTGYLEQILERMNNEYLQILSMVTKYNLENERGIGFWSLIRIIFPVIECVASVMGKQKEDFLERELKVPFGYIVWEIYRHSLMHTDELRYVVYKDKTISWAVHLGNEDIGHIIEDQFNSKPTTIHISIPSLYSSLRDFLVQEIAKKNSSKIQVQVGVHFPINTSKIISELEEIYLKH